jgi:hypothetical protein
MRKTPSRTRIGQIAGFRLRRHHLLQESSADAVTLCRDICGLQAQVMAAAWLQLWARNHALTREEMERPLWRERTLVKTSLMRQTLHIIPADEFHLYISALRSCRVAQALRVMARCGIDREEGESLTPLIMDALSSGPLGRGAIAAAIRPKVSRRVHGFMEKSWSHVRVPIAEGLICYGSGENSEVTFIRVDQWLPHLKTKAIPAAEAQCAVMRKYLRAYGPATWQDFSHWSGIPMQELKPLPAMLEAELAEIPGEKKSGFLLREDAARLKRSAAKEAGIRLLPLFDPYLLAHRDKDHLLSALHYKRVYRDQGWISPVVLVDGKIAGVWLHKVQGKKLLARMEPFEKLRPATRRGIEREAASLAAFLGSELALQFV